MVTTPYRTLAARLSDRDWLILDAVVTHRFLTTRQLARLHFGLDGRATSIPRNTNLTLGRLRDLGLLQNLQRRIGGVRAGSSGLVWQLTDTANRLLAWRQGEPAGSRLRDYEPNATFLEHTLAVAETVLELRYAATRRHIALSRTELEPEAWRPYLDRSGVTVRLKPDLAATTSTDGYDDTWFIEVDRNTESPARIVKKCLQYQEYQRTGHEQAQSGVFPAVVWVVPNLRRREQLRARLSAEKSINARLFTIITLDEIGDLIALGASDFNNQPGGPKGGNAS